MIRRILLALPLALLAFPAGAQEMPADQIALKAHVQFLASDALKGREAGTNDFNIAAEYVAAQMMAAGLKPGGADGSWFQPVTLTRFQPADKPNWTLTRGNAIVPLQFGIDFINMPVPAAPDFTAQGGIVFAGYGIVYPQGGKNDYRGLDVRGKIVALLPGVPKGLPNEVGAHFSDDDQKALIAQKLGARAVIMLESPTQRAEFPFEAIVPYWNYMRSGWAAPDGKPHMVAPGAPVVGYVGPAGSQKLFAGSAIKWATVVAAEKAGTRMPTGPLLGTLQVATKTTVRTKMTHNVIGVMPGSDPVLKHEYLTLTAHLDHVGVGQAVHGDRIYNGAMDNAVGNAVMLEVARAFQQSGKAPRRSMLFLALTAEEKGLIGSEFFTKFPTVPKSALVANINMDMPILTYPLQDLVVLGGERSSLGPVIAQVAAAEALKVVPDPSPEEMFFVRSDHYSFVKAGVPAVAIDSGPGGEGAAAQKLFLAEHYHKPSDQIGLPFDWASAAKFTRVNYGVARAIVDADARPRWNKGDFFGVQFDGYGAK